MNAPATGTLAERHREAARRTVAARSPMLQAFFARIFRRAMRTSFHALRVDCDGPPPGADTPHLVIYANHPSWWDAALYNVLHPHLFAGRAGFAPIDAAMLRQYRFMARIGAIGVDQTSRMGAAAFLATCSHVLETPGHVLWIAAQGRFADARMRPLDIRPGLSHLATRAPRACFVPLAVEYAFWDERTPEALVRFGPAIPAADLADLSPRDASARLEAALTRTLDALSMRVVSRDPAAFETLLAGRAGVGGVYDVWRRMRAVASGRRFVAAHNGGHPKGREGA